MRSGKAVCLGAVLAMSAAPLGAQDIAGALDKLFGNAHNLVLYFHHAGLANRKDVTTRGAPCLTDYMCGAGIELLIDLSSPKTSSAHLELGLGASYLRGFRASKQGIDFRGALRSLPTISAYVSDLRSLWIFTPYLGFSFGLADLWDAQIYNNADTVSRQVSVRGTTFEYGPSPGVEIYLGPWNGAALLEFGYRFRRFPSLDYSNDSLHSFPREIDAGGAYLSIGFAFHLKDDAEVPGYTGTWILTKVDGRDLPVVNRNEPKGPDLTRSEFVGATLDLSPSRCYSLVVQMRIVTYDPADRPVNSVPPKELPPTESGRWWVDDTGNLYLQPDVPCKPTPTEIAGSYRPEKTNGELKVRYRMLGRTLHFKKKQR